MSKNWYSMSLEEVCKELKSNYETGLSDKEVGEKLAEHGLNEITVQKKKTVFQMLIEQFKDFMIIILLIAAIVSGIVGIKSGEGITDTIIILIIVVLNAVIGVAQELKAQKSLDALKNLSAPHCKVLRDSKICNIESKYLVPGDIVILETGDFIPADLRLIEAINLKTQESALTGESVPVEKNSEIINATDIGIGDRLNSVFSSSLVTYGRGKGIVTGTGMNTEVGKIATMIQSVDDTDTPLKRRLEALGRTLGISALVICALIFAVGFFAYNREPLEMFMTAVSLAVAAIPEGLPAISTIVLSIGVQRMVKRNAIIRTLPSVETLGSATIICSDKTGTLTQNKMTVEKIFYNEELISSGDNIKNIDDHLALLINCMTLCNDSKLKYEDSKYSVAGDPTETALVDLGVKYGLIKTDLDATYKRVDEIPFDSERKLMTTVHQSMGKYIVYTKGALDELLTRCKKIYINNQEIELTKEHIDSISNINLELGTNALRVLGMAYKMLDNLPKEKSSLEQDLVFIGLVGMIDPARPEAKDAVEKCRTAGIKPIMITGDHKVTAIAIAKQLGILHDEAEAITGSELEKMSQEELEKNVHKYSVYARVSPEHKVRIVQAWQKRGEVVAMTGDGVNDAPALKTANIGAAMGIVGTDVAKEAADVVLTDDNFATIVSAVEEGRRIYDNILKSIQYLLSSNVGEIITLFVATMLGWAEEPLIPIHILWINLVTDSLPALALSVEPPAKDIMNRKATKSNNIFTKGMIWRVIYQGIMIGGLTLLAFLIGCNFNPYSSSEAVLNVAQTMAFAVLGISQLAHVFNIRSNNMSTFKTPLLSNRVLLGAIFISLLLMVLVLGVPGIAHIFNIAELSSTNLLVVIGLSLSPILIVEIFKLFKINTISNS